VLFDKVLFDKVLFDKVLFEIAPVFLWVPFGRETAVVKGFSVL
jgi:hypothetical protein